MTNLEALQTELADLEVSSNLLTKVLLDNEVTGTDTYAVGNKEKMDICRRDIYLILASSPEITEGSFSIKYPKGRLLALALKIEQKYGLVKPSIDGESVW